MKRLLLFSLGAICSFCAGAQTNKEDIDLIQAIYGKEKKAIVADFIMPPDSAEKRLHFGIFTTPMKQSANYWVSSV